MDLWSTSITNTTANSQYLPLMHPLYEKKKPRHQSIWTMFRSLNVPGRHQLVFQFLCYIAPIVARLTVSPELRPFHISRSEWKCPHPGTGGELKAGTGFQIGGAKEGRQAMKKYTGSAAQGGVGAGETRPAPQYRLLFSLARFFPRSQPFFAPHNMSVWERLTLLRDSCFRKEK